MLASLFALTRLAPCEIIRRRNGGPSLFLVAHEFAHLFDFVNGINTHKPCDNDNCTVQPTSRGAFSFLKRKEPRPENEFPLRPHLCSYFCAGMFIAHDRQTEVFRDLNKANFLSTYATRYPEEDFADSFAYDHLAFDRHATYEVTTVNGERMNVIERLKSEALRSKREYIETFLKSAYRYP